MPQESHAANMLQTLVNLHDGIADGGLGITDRDWDDAKAVLGLKPMVGARLERRAARDIMSPPRTETADTEPSALKTNEEIVEALRNLLKVNGYKEGRKDAKTAEHAFIQGLVFGNPEYAKRQHFALCMMAGRSILSINPV